MDRINKFLNSRQLKHQKTIKYKDEKFVINKEDLKKVRAYKAGKCLDPAIKSIPSRKLDLSEEPAQITKPKRDLSEHFNRRLLEHYSRLPMEKEIEANKNEIVDIWEDEGLEELKEYQQEWIYSITEQYEGKVQDLKFTKEDVENEIKRVYMKHFRPRDIKAKPIRNILPKLPKLDQMRPYPEYQSCEWIIEGKKFLFNSIVCSVNRNRLTVTYLKYNKITVEKEFEEDIHRLAYCEGNLIVSTKKGIFMKIDEDFKQIIQTDKIIKDIYIDKTFIGLLTLKSIHLYSVTDYQEVKILKLKGDTPHGIKISEDTVYSSTHKGIMVDSETKSEIKNLGYVIDFALAEDLIFVVNNLGRLVVVDKNLKIVGNTVQSGIGSQIRHHPGHNLLAILFSNEIGIYKVIDNQCIPLNSITGAFRAIDWDREMPWLYAGHKNKVILFT